MPIGSYRYKRLTFGAVPAGDMFAWKILKIFKDLTNVFGFADDILVSYDSMARTMIKCYERYYKCAGRLTSN